MISYVIATYSNTITARIGCYKNSEHVLQIQLEQLYMIFNKKKSQGVQNLIERIVIVCPEPKEKRNHTYYQSEKWIEKFKEFNIPINYVDYVGGNRHHSYDQWIQGYMAYPNSDYYIVMEDDYCVDNNNIIFDIDMLRIYKEKFKDNIGYLSSVANYYKTIWHAAISNGIISRDAFKKLKEPILDTFYSIKADFPQVMFSILFNNENIPIDDMQEEYVFPFWESWTKTFVNYTKNTKEKYMFIPVQLAQ